MQLIERIMEQYSSDEITLKVAEVFQFINSNVTITQFTETYRVRLIDGISNQLQHQLKQLTPILNESKMGLDQEDEAALVSSFRKMTAFTA